MAEKKDFVEMAELDMEELEEMTGGYLLMRNFYEWDVVDDKGNIVKSFNSDNSKYNAKYHAAVYAYQNHHSLKTINARERERLLRENGGSK